MISKKINFTVGLFVAGGIGIAIAAVIWLGMSRFLGKGQYYVTYFNESVQGLSIDSPVKYRGVSTGRVDRIGVAPDSKLIQVVLKIETGMQLGSDIVAQLKSVGITGSMFVELDRKKEGEPDRTPPLHFPAEYPIVASKPSDISEILHGIDDVLQQVKSLDLQGISDRIKLSLDNTNRVIADADIKTTSENLNRLILNAEKGFGRFETIVAGNEEMIKTAIKDFSQAAENASTLLQKSSSLVSDTDASLSSLKRQMTVVGQSMERAADNLNRLLELLADQPSRALFGQPPKPRKIE